jgi:hypothetical protein
MKTIKKIVIAVFLTITLFSCQRKPDCFGVYMDEVVPFRIQSSEGVDLLDPKNPTSFNIDSIKIYYMMPDGTPKYYYNQNADLSRGFFISNAETYFCISVWVESSSVNGGIMSDTTVTYIQWNSFDTDTIKTFLKGRSEDISNPKYGGNCIFYTYEKVWYNGKLIINSYEEQQQSGEIPIIVK